ncbi:Rieske domain-containing protein [Mycena capillaripes]|nr:Rieske domain-containing protein [Mycena capillaripes]
MTSTPCFGEESPVNLPASWYRSDAIYELERRAIFSKKWLFICHTNRFGKAGEYVRFKMAGYHFFLIKDRDGNINAFHNLCRHRGFPVVGSKQEDEADPMQEAGQVSILACRFHGWSYTMKGALAKASLFQDQAHFDAKKNGLLPIRTHIDKLGFIYINMNMSDDCIKWEEQFGEVDNLPRVRDFPIEKYKYAFTWTFENCGYNWKTLIDNFNECYHCRVAHPGIAATVNLPTYYVQGSDSYISHFSPPKAENADKRESGSIVATYLFPYAAITLMPSYGYTMRVVPIDAHRTEMQYDVYRPTDATDEDFNATHEFFRQVEQEDKYLCTNAQKNMESGMYTPGPLHLRQEHGVLYFQSLIRDALTKHRELEEMEGRKIYPALPDGGLRTQEEMFCNKVESACGGRKELDW